MKNNIRILSVAFLAVIYCFAIGADTKSLVHSDFRHNPTPSQEIIIQDFSAKLFCHTTQSESLVNNFNNLPTPNFKNPYTGLWAIIIAIEYLIVAEFSQYTSLVRNILINHRKSDIIFPFHYFW